MLRVLHNTNFDFIGKWKPVTIGLTVFLVPALVWMLVSGIGRGIEFTGGSLVAVEFKQAPNIGDVRSALAAGGLPDAEVQTYGSPNEIVVRARGERHVQTQAAGDASAVGDRIQTALQRRFGAGSFSITSTEEIGPRVGAELTRNATIALFLSFIVSLIYLAIRFEWRFGLAAVLANMHDIVATFAFIKYMQIEITLFVVGAVLTVIGYSLSDTVVVFDRVRELLKGNERVPLRETLNRAVNETLPRTVMTGTTVIACLLALVVFGGSVLRPFALVLLFGIIVGTISSVYVAAPLLLLIERRWPRAVGEKKGMARAVAAERRQEQKEQKEQKEQSARTPRGAATR